MSSNKPLADDDFEPTSEDIEIQPWDLPYWRGEPPKKSQPEPEEAEELEVQPEPLTVEEIEQIRNSAYDEGFLQGLNEGREKGEAEGQEQGLATGQQQGLAQGEEEGKKLGFEAGHAEGLDQGKHEITAAVNQLSSLNQILMNSIAQNDQALPDVMAQLIKTACQSILEKELQEGDSAITSKVQAALAQLPSGEANIKVYVSPADALHLEHGLVSAGREMHFDIDDSLTAGSGRIVSEHSLLEFSIEERMQQVFEHIDNSCQHIDVCTDTNIDTPSDSLLDNLDAEVSEPSEPVSPDSGVEENGVEENDPDAE